MTDEQKERRPNVNLDIDTDGKLNEVVSNHAKFGRKISRKNVVGDLIRNAHSRMKK